MVVRVLAASIIAVFMAAGCATQQPAPAAVSQADIDRVVDAANKAEQAANRAEVAAEKAEVIFHKSLQK